MRDDAAWLITAYETARDNFLSFYRTAHVIKAPPEMPAQLREVYLLGYERGHRDALQFEPVTPGAVPPELDWQFASAWRCGYTDAESIGIIHRQMLFERVRR